MSSYNYFANVYDELTENVEYEHRADYIHSLLKNNGIYNGTLLDLACGTGTMSLLMKKRGFNIIGIDLSDEMLSIACSKSNGDISLLKADMCNFSLPCPVDACMCNLDSINHLVDINDVKSCFKCVCSSLNENGLFIFDVNTIYKHCRILKDNSFIFDEEDYFLAWDNEWLGDDTIRLFIDIFVYNGKNYDRYSENFLEKAYSIDEMKKALEPYFDVLGVYNDLSLTKPKNESERLYFVCRRK